VALCINHVTCCFDTPSSRSSTAESWYRRVGLAESEPKLQRARAGILMEDDYTHNPVNE